MHCNISPLLPESRAKFGAVVCFFAWLVGIPALLPMAFAALGSLDAQHCVRMEEHAGRMTVVLHHGSGAQSPLHRHLGVARLISAFAQTNEGTQDHIVNFGQAGAIHVSSPAVLPVMTGQTAVQPLTESVIVPSRSIPSDAPAIVPRPPPAAAFALVCLRSTSLRI